MGLILLIYHLQEQRLLQCQLKQEQYLLVDIALPLHIQKQILLIINNSHQMVILLTLVIYQQIFVIPLVSQMVMEVLVSYQAQETAEYLLPFFASVTP